MRPRAHAKTLRALLGSAVGSPGQLTLSASLYESPRGRELATASVSGRAEELPDLIDRLTAQMLSLEAGEFIRRFLLHVLPSGFHRIRHFGFLANGHRAGKLALCRRLLAAPPPLHRLPELFCGFERKRDKAPTLYPVACAPQAWAACAPYLLLQACLGIDIISHRIRKATAKADKRGLPHLHFLKAEATELLEACRQEAQRRQQLAIFSFAGAPAP